MNSWLNIFVDAKYLHNFPSICCNQYYEMKIWSRLPKDLKSGMHLYSYLRSVFSCFFLFSAFFYLQNFCVHFFSWNYVRIQISNIKEVKCLYLNWDVSYYELRKRWLTSKLNNIFLMPLSSFKISQS